MLIIILDLKQSCTHHTQLGNCTS